jgi:glycosyltransferase involved in cell wall biosynthesis
MDAMLEVPGAVLALLGFGPWEKRLAAAVAEAPYAGRVAILPSVLPSELLDWTASADVSVMAIQPSSVNHRYTTPQKLFESIAAGVPVVASDLPGMAEIVRGSDVGLVCDPTSPAAIADAIRTLLSEPEPARVMRRASILRLAHDRYNWERQAIRLLEVYRELLGDASPGARAASPSGGVDVDGADRSDEGQDAAGSATVGAPAGASNRSSTDS